MIDARTVIAVQEGVLFPNVVVGAKLVVVLVSTQKLSGLNEVCSRRLLYKFVIPLSRSQTIMNCIRAQRRPIVSADAVTRVSGSMVKAVQVFLCLCIGVQNREIKLHLWRPKTELEIFHFATTVSRFEESIGAVQSRRIKNGFPVTRVNLSKYYGVLVRAAYHRRESRVYLNNGRATGRRFFTKFNLLHSRGVLRSSDEKRTRRARKDLIERNVLENTFFLKCHQKALQVRVNVEAMMPDTVCPTFLVGLKLLTYSVVKQ